ncbi:MAG: lysine transporter LysE [Candidatus Zixiibacteriota bacterium]|nr:MAG: lysine transporter LysE [candidate division Zixibacteria bacterium]
MELLALFFNSFVIGFSGAIMPGPVLAIDIAETPRHGWQTGPVLSVGHALAEIGVVVVLALGVTVIANHPIIPRAIAVVGGAALVLMGVMMGYDVIRKRIDYDSESAQGQSRHRLIGKGITGSLSNPYWFIWWATIGLVLLVKSQKLGVAGPIVFYFGHILSDFVWYTFVSVLLWKGRRLMMGTGLKVIILSCAVFLVYLGASFFYDGLTGSL